MAPPTVIPIAYVPDYWTDTVGRYSGGQFLASYYAAEPGEPSLRSHTDELRWFVCVHHFEEDGSYRESGTSEVSATRN